jgi:ArsR family transcriptional regulator, zinc-responsive transcriptional repressor
MTIAQTAAPRKLLSLDFLAQAAECLRLMSHPVRLRIVDILMRGRLPVNEIARLCHIPPQQACEHLRLMRGHALLTSRRRGREVYYEIVSPRLPGLMHCILAGCQQKPEESVTE